ncbi:ABC transporter ATP-binding protein [Enterococcus durans]|uniref:ABC transporter ATP-binding protein n=2 Tax=Enterococcus TaxID=1350 RepID=A0A5N0YZ15_9ENTE|nr:ABC transporter ATP-binding protein [Enterococcus durans]TKN14979.1 ABC transporter ATP-binding protein [Enterococcus sp. VV15]KAA9188644.1 ABC transporter ATP-binding protein [Enterococcus durans]KAA9189062.1 ABC transporter ATP-binding protein [Enterococcus durans]KAA9190069.1 ABC transporter ATP-binding protein [Enterococcus durans]
MTMKIQNLKRSYGMTRVLNGINLEIPRGTIVGLIGKNGAGKSTLMKIISKTIKQDSGEITGNENVGYLIESPKLYDNKTGLQNISYFSAISKKGNNIESVIDFLNRIGMSEAINKRVKKYSLGMKQKLGLGIALLNEPDYLVLDEPTNGMDIETSELVLNEFQKLVKEKNIGVLISSHKLDDVQSICREVAFIENGIIKDQENIKNIVRPIYNIRFASVQQSISFIDKQKLGKVQSRIAEEVIIESEKSLGEFISFFKSIKVEVEDISVSSKNLRDRYLNLANQGEKYDY